MSVQEAIAGTGAMILNSAAVAFGVLAITVSPYWWSAFGTALVGCYWLAGKADRA